jgi:hypothetical protein
MTECHVVLEPIYETDEGFEFIVNPDDYVAIQAQMDLGRFRLAFHFQTVDGVCVYAITKDKWYIDLPIYRHLKKNPYTRRMLLKLLILGHFDIGGTRLGSYHIIRDVKSYNSEENNELKLHYTYPRSYAGNVAWRSIKWDLFKQFVEEMNKEAMENDASAAEQRRVCLRMSEV